MGHLVSLAVSSLRIRKKQVKGHCLQASSCECPPLGATQVVCVPLMSKRIFHASGKPVPLIWLHKPLPFLGSQGLPPAEKYH